MQGGGGGRGEVLDVDYWDGRRVRAKGFEEGLNVGFVVWVASSGAPVSFVVEADLVVDEEEGCMIFLYHYVFGRE